MYKLSKIIRLNLSTRIYHPLQCLESHSRISAGSKQEKLIEKKSTNVFVNNYKCMTGIMKNFCCLTNPFSTRKLTKQEIQSSTYSELVNKIISIYNYNEYKIPSALALLQIHHQYQIFKPGHWVLDIGAGPNWSWTDLAIKFTQNYDLNNKESSSTINANKVISNDLKDMPCNKESHIHIVGDFMEQPTRTKIALHLQDRQLDTILIDATPQFTGNQESDGRYTMQIFIKAMQFAEKYLKKGGNIIFKTVECSLSLQNQNQAKFYFHQVHRYKSSSFRINSPTFFYILRGFMMTQNLKGLQRLLIEYKKAKDPYTKTEIVQRYKQKYSWDPILLINNEAKNTVMRMRQQGIKNKQIMKLYENDPFVKISELIKLFEIMDDQNTPYVQRLKAENRLLNINDEQIERLPENQEQFAEVIFENLQKIQNEQRQERRLKKQKKKSKKNIKSKSTVRKQEKEKVLARSPLAQDQVYMKSTKTDTIDIHNQQVRQYKIQDLYGYNPANPTKSINTNSNKSNRAKKQLDSEQFLKLAQSFPQVKEALNKNRSQLQKKQEQAEQFFANLAKQDLNQKADNDILRKLHKINKEKQSDFFFEEQQQNEQQDDLNLQPKKKMKQKQKQLKKSTQMSSEFEFDEQAKQREKEKQIEDYMNSRGQLHSKQLQKKLLYEFNNENKVQYFNSKPRKADRKFKNPPKVKNSYFKVKNKNK